MDYKNLNIYQLREYARSIGVKSPTSKIKLVLLAEISQIKNGILAPVKARRGRCAKKWQEIINNPYARAA